MKAAGIFERLSLVIRIDDGSEWTIEDEKLVKFSDFVKNGEGVERESDSDIMRKQSRGDMSIMLFTSGTTGTSKCVMLSERNQISCVQSAVRATDFYEYDELLSVLPIHHTYELTINVAIQSLGATVCINDSLKNVVKNLKVFKPTGIVIECQEERSQFKNRDKALKMLKTKLYDMKITEQNEKIASDRRSQVGTGDRSERIRTYNYPQGRITDHRIGLTLFSLESFLNGNIGDMIDALITADTAEKLKNNAQ
jgi:acyl-CoA synthetase (AMP-forming)/AMP-acid ligase II